MSTGNGGKILQCDDRRPCISLGLPLYTIISHLVKEQPSVDPICDYTLCCPEADGPTNVEQPTPNHVQSDTMASAVLANPTRALQGTKRGSGPAMEESENDVGNLEQLLLYADEYYLAGKLPLGDHLGKVLHKVEEYHQRNVGPLRFHASQLKWTVYHRLCPQTITPAVRAAKAPPVDPTSYDGLPTVDSH
ncbi:15-hydroxyprostaglandin dehydrogenase [Trichonephila clavipes]|nr:15-hydroxyprostaglandin dehydrogenase [Trichonephila clavipes]